MANCKVELIITNIENHQNIYADCIVTDETAEKVWKDFHSDTDSIPFLNLDDIL